MSNIFSASKEIVYGENALAESAQKISQYGKKAFIVTGRRVSKLPVFLDFVFALEKNGTACRVFPDITGEPTVDMVKRGAADYKKEGADFLVGFGGGSPIDAMKAIAVTVVSGGEITDFLGADIKAVLPKTVAVPTTAGTGSEVTKFTVITDDGSGGSAVKMLLKGDCLVPDLAVIDPICSASSPKAVTASTALDALTHAVEAYTSKKSQPLTDALAVSAVKRIFKYLPVAYADGDNAKARLELAVAATQAGICINNSSVTVVHGMSRPIGALFHVPHGISNAMLLPLCVKYAAEGVYPKLAALGRAIEAVKPTCEGESPDLTGENADKTASDAFIQALSELCKTCEIPTLEQYGVAKDSFFEKIDKMADDALASKSPSNTVKPVEKEDIVRLYKELWVV